MRETGSCIARARGIGLSYRHAWGGCARGEEMLRRSMLDMGVAGVPR
ncbi:hypothetical protein ACU4GD_42105 [Cupriavidus basilensis]